MYRASLCRFTLCLSFAGMTALPLVAAAQDHSHHAMPATAKTSAASPAPAPTSAPTKRWVADAALRRGMADVRNGVEALEHAEHGHMGPEQVTALAQAIEGYIGQIVVNCKLEPRADIALHKVIGKLLNGALVLKKGKLDNAAIASMRQALVEYPRLFDDPDWRAVAPSEH